MEAGTAPLRSAAPNWSLAGDKQLLDALQCLQQRIITKCQETNKKLEELVTALDDASINLQNVNNRFMALSNSQFVESRVYDDDTDITAPTVPQKEPPKPIDSASELDKLKLSLRVLESMHTAVTILGDSDTESDSDGDDVASVVLKPKDMYSDRPLPYIIGSQAWKSKWHAGLLPEDSDSDSSTCKPPREHELYSDSEPKEEDMRDIRDDERTISTSSSELTSKQELAHTQSVQPSPSDIAAELARRLRCGGAAVMPPVRDQQYSPPNPTVRKVYKPEKPTPGTIFFDEPPSLQQSDQSDDECSQDDDIFAELHKNKPYDRNNKGHSVTDELFGSNLFSKNDSYGGKDKDDDIFGVPDVIAATNMASTPIAKPKSTLFEDESEPELFAHKPTEHAPVKDGTTTKKPVGGISLFGTNKNADSIGEAILKRNRKSSTSGEESGNDEPEPSKEEIKAKEIDIFDDLFAKSEKLQKKNVKDKIEKVAKTEKIPDKVVEKDKNVDLFSDNLFDDIDDLFSTNIVTKIPIKEPTNSKKSLFDDEDDLFADLTVTKANPNVIKSDTNISNAKTRSIFDSDDDLFTEKEKPVKSTVEISRTETTKNNELDDSDENSFSKNVQDNPKEITKISNVQNNTQNTKNLNNNAGILKDPKIETNVNEKAPKLLENQNIDVSKIKQSSEIVKSTLLYDDDEIDDLFSKPTKVEATHKPNIVIQKETKKNDNIEHKERMNPEMKEPEIVEKNRQNDIFDSDENIIFNANKNMSIKNKDLDSENISEDSNKSMQNNTFAINHDIFSHSETEATKTKQESSESKIVKKLPIAENYIFEDDDWENDMVTDKTLTNKTNNVGTPILDQKLTPTTEKIKEPENQEVLVKPPNAHHLLGDNRMDDDLFNSKPSRATISSISKTKSTEKPTLSQKPTQKLPESEKPINSKGKEIIEDDFDTNDEKTDTSIKSDTSIKKLSVAQKSVITSDVTVEKPSFAQKPIIANQADKPKIVDEKMEHDILKNNYLEEEFFNTNLGKTTKPNIVKTATDSEKSKIQKDIYENNDFEDDLFNTNINKDSEKPISPQKSKKHKTQESNNVITTTEDNGPKMSKLDNRKEVDANKNITETPQADIFADIFNDQPPIFEKPKEPKKSKNVNALFDDDSDDEALFFKKNDLLEDKPVDLSPKVDDRFVGLFIDEPPAIDDFDDTIDDSQNNQKRHDIIHKTIKTDRAIDNKQIDFKLKDPVKVSDSIDVHKKGVTSKEPKSIDYKLENSTNSMDNVDAVTKKVGKLKPMSFNINVNTLLPGASPKKIKNEEQISNSNEELHTKEHEEIDSKLVKSVSFEGDPESVVLDNKLSKDRPKIQVRRRPSTRRARREAVKKSGIDFGEDSTDNSSSLDDVPRNNLDSKNVKLNDDLRDSKDLPKDDEKLGVNDDLPKENSTIVDIKDIDDIIKHKNKESSPKIDGQSNNKSEEVNITKNMVNEDTRLGLQYILKTSPTRDVKSKIVYILNDEDIFNTKPEDTKTYSDKIKNTKIEKESQGITTLGKVYSETVEAKNSEKTDILNDGDPATSKKTSQTILEKPKTSLFDESSDEELFSNKSVKTKKSTVFESDSENELFGKDMKNRDYERKKEIKDRDGGRKKETVRHSLFSDDDDEDLFGVKPKKVVEPKSQPKAKEQTTNTTTPAYEDPLSLFGNVDE